MAGIPTQRGDESEQEPAYNVFVYVSDDDTTKALEFLDAIRRVYAANNVILTPDGPPKLGSLFQRFQIKFVKTFTSAEAKRLLDKSEAAVQAALLDEPQSRANWNQSNAVAQLLDASAGIDNFVTLTGSMLFIKQANNAGRGSVTSKTLSPGEILYLERNPDSFQSPGALMVRLGMRFDGRSISEVENSTLKQKGTS